MYNNDNNGPLIDSSLKVVPLIPNSGVQFLDYEFDAEAARRVPFRFFADDSQNLHPMIEVEDEDNDSYVSAMGADYGKKVGEIAADDERLYSVSPAKILETFHRHWLPVPVFLQMDKSVNKFDNGPTNWARLYVASLEGGGSR